MQDILAELERYWVSADRKGIYSIIESIQLYRMDIIGVQQERTFYYHLGNRMFEFAELKMLVDAVLLSIFITVKSSRTH
ncbi:hypothetical protein [Anaeromicropila herbilytica]|uniref:Uncharacterized protein n=1 Tax=Anaeromicropila herbilytica TaxID=2785025 RepID=A0A7R7IE72_9FIRM|nr:hypothetical protein [Anaeromicropila herbilytica]BCN31686.1 hypothetical protein bsdtb5_29810 [Anaeromicropila herbilytica]